VVIEKGGVYRYDALASTNETAKEKAKNGAPRATVIIADSQTAGRGRRGRGFYSCEGGVFMSFVLRPRFAVTAAAITTAAAVVVCDAVRAAAGRDCRIKWVNDVLLDGKKICGILTEAVPGDGAVILGVGINVALDGGFPEGLRRSAGAIFPDGADARLKKDVKDRLIGYLIGAFADFPDKTPYEDVMAEYRRLSAVIGREVTVIAPAGEYAAFAEDIDGAGRLMVRTADGTSEALSSGEISVRL
jgi:BirA family biotin operon repressor/biotin-[acetyl-CoA-carboxylase] ligase